MPPSAMTVGGHVAGRFSASASYPERRTVSYAVPGMAVNLAHGQRVCPGPGPGPAGERGITCYLLDLGGKSCRAAGRAGRSAFRIVCAIPQGRRAFWGGRVVGRGGGTSANYDGAEDGGKTIGHIVDPGPVFVQEWRP